MANTRRLKPDQITKMFRRFQEVEPAPTTELTWTDPYTLLVAVVLSAQATDVSVNRATNTLFKIANTPQKMMELGEEKLLDYIKGINFNRGKAKNVIGLSKALIEKHGGEVPPDRATLEALPGVGRKSANVVLNTAFGEPVMAVDTHIFRVGNRTGLAPGKDVREVETALEKAVPDQYKRYAHHWLILHGRYVCKARKPECWRCLIRDICLFKPKTPPPA
jgi:endonuclease III